MRAILCLLLTLICVFATFSATGQDCWAPHSNNACNQQSIACYGDCQSGTICNRAYIYLNSETNSAVYGDPNYHPYAGVPPTEQVNCYQTWSGGCVQAPHTKYVCSQNVGGSGLNLCTSNNDPTSGCVDCEGSGTLVTVRTSSVAVFIGTPSCAE